MKISKEYIITDNRKHGGKRRAPVTVLIPHHAAGVISGGNLAAYMKNTDRQISATYCIGGDGSIYQTLDESLEPYTTGNRAIDTKAITFEIANSTMAPDYKITEKAFKSLVKLSIDICKRHGIKKLYYDGTKAGSNVHLHEWYQNTNCPGPYIKRNIKRYVNEVNAGLNSATTVKPNPKPNPKPKYNLDSVVKAVIAGKYGNGNDRKNRLRKEGYDPDEVQRLVNLKLLKPTKKPIDRVVDEVIRGLWGNGNVRKEKLKKAGYNPQTIQSLVNKKLRG